MTAVLEHLRNSAAGVPADHRSFTRTFWQADVPPELARRDLGWATLDDILAREFQSPEAFRLIDSEARLHDSAFASKHAVNHGQQWAWQAKPLLDRLTGGATLTMDAVDTIQTRVMRNREIIEYASHQRAWCNAFVSHTSVSAFDWHKDEHDTLIVQGEGRKRWEVKSPDGVLVFAGEVAAGSVLHVPMAWPHRVTGLGEPSLHWTFGWHPPSLRTAVMEDWRFSDRLGEDPDGGDGAIQPLESWDEFKRTMCPARRTGTSLPWTFSAAGPDVGHHLRWAARYPPLVSRDGRDLVVRSLGLQVRIGAVYAGLIEALASGAEVSSQLVADGLCTAEDLRKFIDWGLTSGLLIVRPAA